jgi:outer membrane protein OmpA-like peptidoglycan-associated protein/tetratricopeptide (TPR) repeat protein
MIFKAAKYLFLSGALFFGFALQAQNCGPSSSKKVQKLLDGAMNNSRLEIDERIDLFRKSLEVDPECIECLFGKARAEYGMAMEQNTGYDRAYRDFVEVITSCPKYHADAYYYSGIIAYANQDYENAQKYFEGFLTFDKEQGKSSRDHNAKEGDIASVLPEVRFYNEFYSNPVEYNPRRLANVNTDAGEYLPMLSPDNQLIFFTRKSKEKAKGDLYAKEVERFMIASQIKETNEYENAEPLAPPFNVGDNYGGVTLSLDNREMFITVCKPVSSNYKNCDLYVSRYERETNDAGKVIYNWTGLENLGENVNTSDGWEAQPTLSADGNTLYFATIRENTTPDKEGNPTIDIFYTERSLNGPWSKAQPIGDVINTDGNDKSPVLHADSRTMYFASNGHLGAGGYDIFYSKQEEDGGWTKPKNIGYPVNSPQDEHGLVVSTDGKVALFSSSNVSSAKELDIFAFNVPKAARPEKVLILKGDVKNAEGELVSDAKIEIKYAATKEIKEVDVDDLDGTYAAVINLRKGEDVVVSIKSETEDLAFNTRVFTLADTSETVRDLAIKVEKLVSGKTYRMNDIRFATGSSEIDEASKSVLSEFADYLNENLTYQVDIYGHTDDVGDNQANLALSADRAFEVFGYLQESGVNPDKMNFKGYGESKPMVPNNSDADRAINRRTEFKIVKR